MVLNMTKLRRLFDLIWNSLHNECIKSWLKCRCLHWHTEACPIPRRTFSCALGGDPADGGGGLWHMGQSSSSGLMHAHCRRRPAHRAGQGRPTQHPDPIGALTRRPGAAHLHDDDRNAALQPGGEGRCPPLWCWVSPRPAAGQRTPGRSRSGGP